MKQKAGVPSRIPESPPLGKFSKELEKKGMLGYAGFCMEFRKRTF